MELYRDATWILEYLDSQAEKKRQVSGSLQAVIARCSAKYKCVSDKKRLHALLSSLLRVRNPLERVLEQSGIYREIPKGREGRPAFDKRTLLLVCNDLLVSRHGRIQMGRHPLKRYVLKFTDKLRDELLNVETDMGIKSLADLAPTVKKEDIPPVRWIRINPLRCDDNDVETVHRQLINQYPKIVQRWQELHRGSIYIDEFVPNLYGLHPEEKLINNELYKEGKIIIQDRGSCFPAHILSPKANDVVADACAAPGNKTTHVAACLALSSKSDVIKGKVYAFERDPERAKTLEKMVQIAGCDKMVEVQIGDFTKLVTAETFADVTCLLVDPSCSGSGVFGRSAVDSWNEQGAGSKKRSRLAKLASFQFSIVKHALKLPSARRVVYSTCSVHAEENEQVVADLLQDSDVQRQGWKLAPRSKVIPTWERRGISAEFEEKMPRAKFTVGDCEALADSCIRAQPKEDGGIGFFAVCFERDF